MTVDDYEYLQTPTEGHLREIGRIVVESAVLANVLEVATWQPIAVPPEAGEPITPA